MFQLETRAACGAVVTDEAGGVVWSVPYFRRTAMGRPLNEVILGLRSRGWANWSEV